MDNASKIDEILDKLMQRVAQSGQADIAEVPFSDEQLAIKSILDERRIHYLIHFTDAKNIQSIIKNGILSVEESKKRGIEPKCNDEGRHDNEPDYISLSVSGMNTQLYKSFRNGKKSIEHGVAIVINAEMLYKEIDTKRIYCVTNAATSDAHKGVTIEDLKAMFADVVEYSTSKDGTKTADRLIEKRNSYETTDIQAEILWNKCVLSKYVLFYWDLEENFFYGN